MIINRTRIPIEPGQVIFRTRNPLWYARYNPEIEARGQVLWVNYDAAMVCVSWTYIGDNQVFNQYQMLGSYDIDRYDTHYAVIEDRRDDLAFPAWLTATGFEYWNNIMFRYMR